MKYKGGGMNGVNFFNERDLGGKIVLFKGISKVSPVQVAAPCSMEVLVCNKENDKMSHCLIGKLVHFVW